MLRFWTVLIFAVLINSVARWVAADDGQEPSAVKMQRVQIVTNQTGKSVRGGNGELLRGASIGLFKFARDTKSSDYIYDDSYWKLLKKNGFNAIRVVFFDPWQRSHGNPGTKKPYPFADLSSDQDVAQLLREFDHVIDRAKANRMYVLVNYHDTGGYHDPKYLKPANPSHEFSRGKTIGYLKRFWKIIASRYADRKHVFYELTNEPVQWSAEEYTAQNLTDFKTIYDQVRIAAPNTHIVLLTFANHASFKRRRFMVDVARDFRRLGVEFKNESVAYHPYNGYYPKPNSGKHVRTLMREFPVINTEQNFPKDTVSGSSDPDASGFDGDHLGVQSSERLGISWFHWQCDTPAAITENFQRMVVPDAKSKGYYWLPKK